MLSKEERRERNTAFWADFRKRMKQHRSSNGRAINWINYPTEVKDTYLRMELDGEGARLCFEIQSRDEGIRSILWEQMTELKRVLENEMGPSGVWEFDHHVFNRQPVSRIAWNLENVNFYQDEDLPTIAAFLQEKLLAFDRFYQEYKDILINLAS